MNFRACFAALCILLSCYSAARTLEVPELHELLEAHEAPEVLEAREVPEVLSSRKKYTARRRREFFHCISTLVC